MHACQHEFIRLIRENSRRHRLHEVFRDFCEMAALAVSNSVDRHQFEAREARYMQIIKRYERDEIKRFPTMFSVMTEGLAATPHDFLGAVFMALELSDSWKGQFFTPTVFKNNTTDVVNYMDANGLCCTNPAPCYRGRMTA